MSPSNHTPQDSGSFVEEEAECRQEPEGMEDTREKDYLINKINMHMNSWRQAL